VGGGGGGGGGGGTAVGLLLLMLPTGRGKSLHGICRRTRGQEPADPFVSLGGRREKLFEGFLSGSASRDIVTGSLYLLFFRSFLTQMFT